MNTLQVVESVAVFLVDVAVKGTALLLLGCIVTLFMRRASAASRHTLWALTMLALVLLPLATWMLPEWRIPLLPSEPTIEVADGEADVMLSDSVQGLARQTPLPAGRIDTDQDHESAIVVGQSPATSRPQQEAWTEQEAEQEADTETADTAASLTLPRSSKQRRSLAIVSVWSVGVVLLALMFSVGLLRTVNFRTRSRLVVEGDWHRLLRDFASRLNLKSRVELREHSEAIVPFTWGVLKPVVLIPRQARKWDDGMKRAVLLHELAHVQRGDVAWQLVARCACTLFWFHPLAWFALRRLRHEREQACDDAVVHAGEKASDYAEQLLRVARLCCTPRNPAVRCAMADGSSLEWRIKALFDSARGHGPVRRAVAFAMVSLGGATLATVACFQPVAAAGAGQQADPATPVVSAPSSPPQAKVGERPAPDTWKSGTSALERLLESRPVFGEAKDGLKFGLAFASPKRRFAVGERIPLEFFFSNVGEKRIDFSFMFDFSGRPPILTNSKGERVEVSFVNSRYRKPIIRLSLQPGEAIAIPTSGIGLGQQQDAPSMLFPLARTAIKTNVVVDPFAFDRPRLRGERGQYTLHHALSVTFHSDNAAERHSEKIRSGLLSFTIAKDQGGTLRAAPVSTRHASLVSAEHMKIARPVFGKPQHGIAMGIAFSTLTRKLSLGDRIEMDLLFRNVSDKEVTFEFMPDFNWSPPAVTGANGSRVTVPPFHLWLLEDSHDVALQPGEVYAVRTAGLGLAKDNDPLSVHSLADGRYKVEYERWITVRAEGQDEVEANALKATLKSGALHFEVTQPDGELHVNLK